jgi:hypothetical protein
MIIEGAGVCYPGELVWEEHWSAKEVLMFGLLRIGSDCFDFVRSFKLYEFFGDGIESPGSGQGSSGQGELGRQASTAEGKIFCSRLLKFGRVWSRLLQFLGVGGWSNLE